jgi:F-type H+-transporting ATPase subunit delta
MTRSSVAARYAGALVDVVTGPSGAPQETLEQLRRFERLLASSTELRHALDSPAVAASRKRAVVSRLAEELTLSGVAQNFLFVLIDHRRLDALSQILDLFEIQLDERLGFARAQVSSARQLNENQRAGLSERLEQLTGKRVRVQFVVDPGLIGGVVARIGSTVYDGSVRGQLAALERRLGAEG